VKRAAICHTLGSRSQPRADRRRCRVVAGVNEARAKRRSRHGRPDQEHRPPSDGVRDVGRQRGAEDVAHQEHVAVEAARAGDRRREPAPDQDRERRLREGDRQRQQGAAREDPEDARWEGDGDSEDDKPGPAERDEAPCPIPGGKQRARYGGDAHREDRERSDRARGGKAKREVGADVREGRWDGEEDRPEVERRQPDQPKRDGVPAQAQIRDPSGTGLFALTQRNTSLVASWPPVT
jgi:hypothetical protein